jgi:hypothetical protein
MKLGMTPWDIAKVRKLANGLADPSSDFSLGFKDTITRGASGYSTLGPEPRLSSCFNVDASLFERSPGRYSGTMRKVVQMMLGLGYPVPFSYGFSKSHGIWLAGDGTPWVIEIATRGVHAAPLPIANISAGTIDAFKTKQSAAGYDLDFIPTGGNPIPTSDDALAEAVEAGTVLQLAASSALAGFYALSAYFSDCGWAFSYSGGEAQNTAWAMDVTNTWVEGYRFKITFSETAGAPTVASITEAERGYLHGDRVTHFKVPASRIEGVVSFDIFRGEFSGPGDHDTTFYVFYDGETAKLCKYFSARDVSTTVYSDDISGSDPLAVHVIESAGVYPWPGTTRKNGTETIRQPAEVYVSSADGSVATSFTGTIKNFFVQHWGTPSYLHSSGLTGNLVPDSGANCVHKLSGGTESSGATYTATIPYGDREAIYIYKQESTTRSGMTEDRNGYGICCGDERQTVNNGYLSAYGIVYASTSGYPAITAGVIYENSSFGNLQAALYPCPEPTASGPPPTPNVAIGAAVPGITTIVAGAADAVKTRTDTLKFYGSGVTHTFWSGRDIKATYPDGCTEWNKFVVNPPLAAGCTTDFQIYASFPDTFTGNRLISNSTGSPGGGNIENLGVNGNYSDAWQDPNIDRFFFGVP